MDEKLGRVEDRLTAKIESLNDKVVALDKTVNEFRADVKNDLRETRMSFRNNTIAAVTLPREAGRQRRRH
ncbi:MAG: hypothetical protein LBR38_01530 [Synergistaceae bacterium]|jgi:phage host-nuclease inhibitor protein Gam|nr:hypothetical protein [Synergistaceae bacterium]